MDKHKDAGKIAGTVQGKGSKGQKDELSFALKGFLDLDDKTALKLAFEFLLHHFLQVGKADLERTWRQLFPNRTVRSQAEERLKSLLVSGHSLDLARLGVAAAVSRSPQFARDFSKRVLGGKGVAEPGGTPEVLDLELGKETNKTLAMAAGCVLLQGPDSGSGVSNRKSAIAKRDLLKSLIPVGRPRSRTDLARRELVLHELGSSSSARKGTVPKAALLAVADFVASTPISERAKERPGARPKRAKPASNRRRTRKANRGLDPTQPADEPESSPPGFDLELEGEGAEAGPSLSVNQWLTDSGGANQKMEAPLMAGRNYNYWFEISGAVRQDASSEAFIAPEELEREGGVDVEVEVRCSLLRAEEGYLRRPVRYLPGEGLKPVSFPLFAEIGSHWLRVNLLHQGKPVFSRSWPIEVLAGDAMEEAKPPRLASLPPGYLSQGAMVVVRAAAEFNDDVMLEIPGLLPLRGRKADRALMVNLAAKARTILTGFSQRHDPDEESRLAWEEVWESLLSPMIDWGREAAKLLFGASSDLKLIPRLLELETGSRIHVDSSPGSFPWEWLFLDESYYPNEPPGSVTEAEPVLANFCGCRFRVEVLPCGEHDRRRVTAELDNSTRTVVFSAVNASADAKAAPLQAEFVESIGNRDSVRREVLHSGGEVIGQLKKAVIDAGDSCHLLYIFAHHSPGSSLNQFGYFDFGDSTLYLKGKNQDPLTRRDIENKVFGNRSFLPGASPLIFLNACGTAAGGDYFPSALLPFFALRANAPAVVGTVADINALAAHQFAKEFIPRWLGGLSATRALAEIRRDWLFRKGNPYGLYYTVCGEGEAHLRQPSETRDEP